MVEIELNGDDLRREPLEMRKATLVSVLAKAGPGLRLNEHLEHEDGETVFRHACKLGLDSCPSPRTRPTALAARPIGSS
jgi:bifunctional non-homologous end joining protein LigD